MPWGLLASVFSSIKWGSTQCLPQRTAGLYKQSGLLSGLPRGKPARALHSGRLVWGTPSCSRGLAFEAPGSGLLTFVAIPGKGGPPSQGILATREPSCFLDAPALLGQAARSGCPQSRSTLSAWHWGREAGSTRMPNGPLLLKPGIAGLR